MKSKVFSNFTEKNGEFRFACERKMDKDLDKIEKKIKK